MRIQMPAIKTSLTVSQRVGGGTHLPQIVIGTDMEITDHLQIIVQHLIKITVL